LKRFSKVIRLQTLRQLLHNTRAAAAGAVHDTHLTS